MRTNAAIADQDTGYTAPVEKKVLDLIQRFNDPDQEHALRGIFKGTDGLELCAR